MRKIKLLLLSLVFMTSAYGQVSNDGKPTSWRLTELPDVAPVQMPSFNLDSIQAEDKVRDAQQNKPWRFGYEFLVDNNLENSGSWQTLENGDRIWRIRYTSNGAKTMNFVFSDYFIPKGAKVYLYNNDRTDLLGAYDEKQNNERRILGTWLVKGEDIWIEYYEPAAVTGQGRLEVFKVVHGYRTKTFTEIAFDDSLNQSGNCHYDVDCYVEGIENLKEISKKAVAMLITGGNGFCTGTLVNNTAEDGTPYFLTANHCYEGNDDPAQWAFLFNWVNPNPICAESPGSTSNTDYHLTASGAVLRARRTQSDFCLVEITTELPDEWDLKWAGWDISTTIPPFLYGIHHPRGDIMKVSADFDAPTLEITQVDVGDGPVSAEVWTVEEWDLTGLQQGSSGSAMFDNNGLVRGQAWYVSNPDFCNGTVATDQSTGYGRFDKSWNTGGTAATRLKDWLDPAGIIGTGQTSIGYYPPQNLFAIDAKVLFFDKGYDNCGTNVTPTVRLINNGIDNLTSAQVSYSINDGEPVIIEWTGNLGENEGELIELPELALVTGQNVINITILNPNESEDMFVQNNTVTNVINTAPVNQTGNITVNVNTDGNGSEVKWKITLETESSSFTLYNSPNYGNNQTYTNTYLMDSEGCYAFTITDEGGDGLGTGSYSVTMGDNVIIEGGDFGNTETVFFSVDNMAGLEDFTTNPITVYPNPSAGIYTVSVNQGLTDVNYTIFNMLGQAVANGKFVNGANTVNITGMSKGVYFIKAADASGKMFTTKLIKE
ncbi:T9SS type A sorting domain-containing protein [Flavobacterium sp.]|uniref:T9SS type A sorting domain-containing protein n=1 Tax=Flavobacterium sp. TaxID=239 RepID=UPI003A9582FA